MPDAEAVLREARSVGVKADYVVTDSHQTYDRAVRRTVPGSVHVKTLAMRDGFTNMAIERYHNEIHEKLKSCRGLDTADTAQVFFDLLRIHHNFVRPHMGLDGSTPAEAAGVADAGVKDAKYRALIRASSKAGKGVATKLGKLAGHVHVRNRGDVTVTPKEWLETETWKEIDAILKEQGFRWMFNKVMRGWIRFEDAPPMQDAGDTRKARRAPV